MRINENKKVVKIHWEYEDGKTDSAIFEGDDFQDVRAQVESFIIARGLDVKNNNFWSEELKGKDRSVIYEPRKTVSKI